MNILNKMFAPFMDADKGEGGNGAVNEVQVEAQTNEAKAEALLFSSP